MKQKFIVTNENSLREYEHEQRNNKNTMQWEKDYFYSRAIKLMNEFIIFN